MPLLYFRMASGQLWIFKLYNEMFIHEYFAVIDNHLYFYTNMKIFGIYVFEWIGVAEIWKLLKSMQGTKQFLCWVPEALKSHFAFVTINTSFWTCSAKFLVVYYLHLETPQSHNIGLSSYFWIHSPV